MRTPVDRFFIQIFVYQYSDGSYHRAIPSFLAPYKHYSIQTIETALDLECDLDQYDLPSDSSRYRWNVWLETLLLLLDNILASVVEKPADDATSLLQWLREKHHRNTHKSPDYLSSNGWMAVITAMCHKRL